MIPGYRARIYRFIGALLFLLVAFLWALDLYNALTTWQLDALTGPRRNTINEHLVFDEQPERFVLYLLQKVLFFFLSVVVGLGMLWEALWGRRAFKHRQ
ncbi:hypothetical protein PMI32_03587 [Pseudomonas sp. GM60]|nr:hypothetical protein PMI32_03587 [Pseudomonas sp. GM60]